MTILFQAKFLVLFIIFLYSDNAYGWRSAKWVNFDGYLILDCKDREVGNSWPKNLPISKKKKKFKVFLNKKDNKWSASKLGVSNKKIAQKKATVKFYESRDSITFYYYTGDKTSRIKESFTLKNSLGFIRESTIYNSDSTITNWGKGFCKVDQNNNFGRSYESTKLKKEFEPMKTDKTKKVKKTEIPDHKNKNISDQKLFKNISKIKHTVLKTKRLNKECLGKNNECSTTIKKIIESNDDLIFETYLSDKNDSVYCTSLNINVPCSTVGDYGGGKNLMKIINKKTKKELIIKNESKLESGSISRVVNTSKDFPYLFIKIHNGGTSCCSELRIYSKSGLDYVTSEKELKTVSQNNDKLLNKNGKFDKPFYLLCVNDGSKTIQSGRNYQFSDGYPRLFYDPSIDLFWNPYTRIDDVELWKKKSNYKLINNNNKLIASTDNESYEIDADLNFKGTDIFENKITNSYGKCFN